MSQASEFSVGLGLIYPRLSCRTTACDRARNWIRYSIKQARPNAIERTVARILEDCEGTALEALLDHAGALVPVPASAPRELLDCKRLTLVDDVVTRGSTMMGCILKLREDYPDIEVQGFALARVEEAELEEPSQMLSPKVETVIYTPTSTPILVRR